MLFFLFFFSSVQIDFTCSWLCCVMEFGFWRGRDWPNWAVFHRYFGFLVFLSFVGKKQAKNTTEMDSEDERMENDSQ
jgi:hypothetical protein